MIPAQEQDPTESVESVHVDTTTGQTWKAGTILVVWYGRLHQGRGLPSWWFVSPWQNHILLRHLNLPQPLEAVGL